MRRAGAVKLNSLVFGRPSAAAPLTVLHGMLGSSRNWRSLGPRMADRLNRLVSPGSRDPPPFSDLSLLPIKVYVLDARNHGDSPHTSEMSFTLMSRDTVEFLREREVTRTVLIGHSMGGASAMFTTLK